MLFIGYFLRWSMCITYEAKAVGSVSAISCSFIHTILNFFFSLFLSHAHTNTNPLFSVSEDVQIRKIER